MLQVAHAIITAGCCRSCSVLIQAVTGNIRCGTERD